VRSRGRREFREHRALVRRVENSRLVAGPPKSRAGVRSLDIPAAIRADILAHLETYVGRAQDAASCLVSEGRYSTQTARQDSSIMKHESLGTTVDMLWPGVLHVERMTGIEPAFSAWEADVLPLNYIRRALLSLHGRRSLGWAGVVE
jgi:hypothetical protein